MKKNTFPSAVGIIAEYNPFHNGHAYHIARAKELSGAKYCIAVMSGDFVQRGAPAVFDKYIRTAMALSSGVDLVVEMPSLFATSSAEDFASCGVALLDKLGVVSHLCFGSECGEISPLSAAADILAQEPELYTGILKEQLRLGSTYPGAREYALLEYLRLTAGSTASSMSGSAVSRDGGPEPVFDSLGPVLRSPNNILGIEYCKALKKRGSPIIPLTVKRTGSGYHDLELTDEFASASGIRRILSEGDLTFDDYSQVHGPASGLLRSQVPEAVYPLVTDSLPLFLDDFSALLSAALLRLAENGGRPYDYADVSEELAARLMPTVLEFDSFAERIRSLKTRQYTYTRVSRALLHLMLGMKKEDVSAARALDYAPYARVLGFKKDSSPLLSQIKKYGDIPLITKTADAEGLLPADAYRLLRQDFYASHLYSVVWNSRYHRPVPNEYSRQIVRL